MNEGIIEGLINELHILAEGAASKAADHAPPGTDQWRGMADGLKFATRQMRSLAANSRDISADSQLSLALERALLGASKELRDYAAEAEKLSFSAQNEGYYMGLRDGYQAAVRLITLVIFGGHEETTEDNTIS
jgi:hypothetical protein